MRRIKFVLLLLLAFCINAGAQNKVGIVVGITGTASFKDANGKEQKLTARNFAVSLSVGQSLKADGQGRVQIKLCNGKTETVGSRWYRVSQVICSSTTNPEKRKVLASIFDFGGRYKTNRGSNEFILFPLEKELTLIRPETVAFRWRPINKKIFLAVTVVGNDNPIWSSEVDGAIQCYTSDGLRKALSRFMANEPGATLRLKVSIPTLSTENSADFQIFPLTKEKDLERDLAQFDNEPAVFRYLARVGVYSSYQLYVEMADEYEEALKLSPDSVDLLNANASAQDHAGNFERRDQILNQIKAIVKVK